MMNVLIFGVLLVIGTMYASQGITTFMVLFSSVSLATLCIFCVIVPYVVSSTDDLINTFDDHELHVNTYNDNNTVTINMRKDCRSPYAKFVYYNYDSVVCSCHGGQRDREPSRIPVKKLTRLSQKSRKLRRYVWKKIVKNSPKSSKIHCFNKGLTGHEVHESSTEVCT